MEILFSRREQARLQVVVQLVLVAQPGTTAVVAVAAGRVDADREPGTEFKSVADPTQRKGQMPSRYGVAFVL